MTKRLLHQRSMWRGARVLLLSSACTADALSASASQGRAPFPAELPWSPVFRALVAMWRGRGPSTAQGTQAFNSVVCAGLMRIWVLWKQERSCHTCCNDINPGHPLLLLAAGFSSPDFWLPRGKWSGLWFPWEPQRRGLSVKRFGGSPRLLLPGKTLTIQPTKNVSWSEITERVQSNEKKDKAANSYDVMNSTWLLF